jgi:hypothetical protein
VSSLELNRPHFVPRVLLRRKVCPLCSSFEFNTAEIGPMDALLRLLRLKPIRCANCYRRYYCWAAGEKIR